MKISMVAMIILAIIILFSTWFVVTVPPASKGSGGMKNWRRLMLKYDLHVACVEYEPGNDLLFSNPDHGAYKN